MTGAVALPLDLPGTSSASSTPLSDVTGRLRAQLLEAETDLDPSDEVMLVMVEQLAATIDAAARTGRASAAAMAARELREAIKHLQDRHAAGGEADPEAEFVGFAAYLRESIESSGGAA